MKQVTLTSRVAMLCCLVGTLLHFAGSARADEIGIAKEIVGRWEYVKGPEGDPKWDVEFTNGGEVLLFAGEYTFKGKYKVLDENSIETEIRSIVNPEKVTFTKLSIKVDSASLTITEGDRESIYRRAKKSAPPKTGRRSEAPANAPAAINPDAKVRQQIKKLVVEMQQALIEGNFARVADLTYAKVIEHLGGRDKAIADMKAALGGAQGAGFTFKLVGVDLPTDFAKSGKTFYAVVPYKLETTGQGATFTQAGYVIGVSPDEGRSWTFIDGGDPEGLRQFLPELPQELRLPENPGIGEN